MPFLTLRKNKYACLGLVWGSICEWQPFQVERTESISIEESSALLFSLGNRYHFASLFQDSMAFLHASEHLSWKVIEAEQTIKRVFLDNYIEFFISKGQLFQNIVMLILNAFFGPSLLTFDDLFRVIQASNICMPHCDQFLSQVGRTASQFQYLEISHGELLLEDGCQLIRSAQPLEPLAYILLISRLPIAGFLVIQFTSHQISNFITYSTHSKPSL